MPVHPLGVTGWAMFEANQLFGFPNGLRSHPTGGAPGFCDLEYGNPCIDFKCADYRGRIGCSDLAGLQKLISAKTVCFDASRFPAPSFRATPQMVAVFGCGPCSPGVVRRGFAAKRILLRSVSRPPTNTYLPVLCPSTGAKGSRNIKEHCFGLSGIA
jgi:hypothetical protein